MKRLLTILIFSLLVSSAYSQTIGRYSMQKRAAVAADTLGPEMIADGSFAIGGTNPWNPGTSWSIASNKATYDDVASGNLVQVTANMASEIEALTTYRLTFTIESAGNAYIRFGNSTLTVIFKDYANYANESHVVRFTTLEDVGAKGFALRSQTTSTASFSIINVSLKKVL